jgi:hypothetical protein
VVSCNSYVAIEQSMRNHFYPHKTGKFATASRIPTCRTHRGAPHQVIQSCNSLEPATCAQLYTTWRFGVTGSSLSSGNTLTSPLKRKPNANSGSRRTLLTHGKSDTYDSYALRSLKSDGRATFERSNHLGTTKKDLTSGRHWTFPTAAKSIASPSQEPTSHIVG